jgi:hypothetical protein
VPTHQDFISPSLDHYFNLFLQVIVVVVIDSISPKGTSLLALVEGIDQKKFTFYSPKIQLTFTNPILAKFTNFVVFVTKHCYIHLKPCNLFYTLSQH